jgi:transposase
VQFTVALSTVAELGDLSRFDSLRQLMSYLGLTPSSTRPGNTRRLGGTTRPAMPTQRQGEPSDATASRDPPPSDPRYRLEGQVRLCKRYHRLVAKGENPNVVVVAIAREFSAFLWAIARQVPLAAHPAATW